MTNPKPEKPLVAAPCFVLIFFFLSVQTQLLLYMYTTLNCKTTPAQKIGLILFSTLNPTFIRIDPVHHSVYFLTEWVFEETLKSAESCGFELSKKWGLFCLNSSNFMSLVMGVSLSHWDKCDPYEIELLF